MSRLYPPLNNLTFVYVRVVLVLKYVGKTTKIRITDFDQEQSFVCFKYTLSIIIIGFNERDFAESR